MEISGLGLEENIDYYYELLVLVKIDAKSFWWDRKLTYELMHRVSFSVSVRIFFSIVNSMTNKAF